MSNPEMGFRDPGITNFLILNPGIAITTKNSSPPTLSNKNIAYLYTYGSTANNSSHNLTPLNQNLTLTFLCPVVFWARPYTKDQ